MIVDIIDKLIDRCIQLVRHKEEVHRRLYDDFVHPVHLDFEAVHQDYLDTFRRYREMVKAPETSLNAEHPVLDALEEDAVFNAKLRVRIGGMISSATDPLLGDFIRSISEYFFWVGVGTDDLIFKDSNFGDGPNVARQQTLESLRNIFDSEDKAEVKRSQAIKTIDGIVGILQSKYAAEVAAFSNLKKALLTPK